VKSCWRNNGIIKTCIVPEKRSLRAVGHLLKGSGVVPVSSCTSNVRKVMEVHIKEETAQQGTKIDGKFGALAYFWNIKDTWQAFLHSGNTNEVCH
jgi:hypothetical protein